MMRDNEYAPLYERYALNPKPDADSDKGGNHFEHISKNSGSHERSPVPFQG